MQGPLSVREWKEPQVREAAERFWQDLPALPAHLDTDLHVKQTAVSGLESTRQQHLRKPRVEFGVHLSVSKEATSRGIDVGERRLPRLLLTCWHHVEVTAERPSARAPARVGQASGSQSCGMFDGVRRAKVVMVCGRWTARLLCARVGVVCLRTR